MKKHFLVSIFCLLQLFVFAVAPARQFQNKSFIIAREWKTEYKDASVKIESSILTFENSNAGIKHERVIFRYINLTSNSIVLSFARTLYYDGICYGCDKQEKRFELVLAPAEIKEFSTDENKDKTYYVFSKDLENTISKKLDSFQLVKIEALTK